MNKKVSDTYCKNIKKPGMHAIGHGLYLRVQASKTDLNHITKSWILRWGAGGKYTMGLGTSGSLSGRVLFLWFSILWLHLL